MVIFPFMIKMLSNLNRKPIQGTNTNHLQTLTTAAITINIINLNIISNNRYIIDIYAISQIVYQEAKVMQTNN